MGNCISFWKKKKKASETTIQSSSQIIPVWPPASAFPSDVLKWMKENADARMAIKLMHLCKYYQLQEFECFVAKDVSCFERTIWYTALNEMQFYWDKENIPENLWIMNSFSRIYAAQSPSISVIMPKVIFCSIQKLILVNENIAFGYFKVLTSFGNVAELELQNLNVFDKFGGAVPIEDIFDCVPKIEEISFGMITPTFTSKEAVKKCLLPNLRTFDLFTREKDFNVEAFIEFLKIHKTAYFYFNCDVGFNNFLCIHQLQAFVDEIIEAADLRYPPPKISFVDQLEDSITALNELRKAFERKNKSRV